VVTDLITDKLFGAAIGKQYGLKIFIINKLSLTSITITPPFFFYSLPFISIRKDILGVLTISRMMDAVILSLNEDNKEFIELVRTLDLDIKRIFIQKRSHADPKSFIGKGKLKEVESFVKEDNSKLILVNGIIKPSQHYHLEQTLGAECVDRIGLILKIFASRSSDLESKLQIEAARLKYEMPLLREWIHRSKSGEHPGFMAGGEYRIDIYYDRIKRRANKISKRLEKIRADREIKREYRKKRGYKTLAFVGYTNAGKSALFNVLTRSSVFVDNKLFSTLSIKSRKISDQPKPIIITDTIGFIEDMPHWIVESFLPTLEEIKEADCQLWIFDGSDSEKDLIKKYRICKDVLNMKKTKIQISVITKSDLLSEKEITSYRKIIKDLTGTVPIIVSAKTSRGIENLITNIIESVRAPIKAQIAFKSEKQVQQAISWIFDSMDVIKLKLWCSDKDLSILKDKFGRIINKIDIID